MLIEALGNGLPRYKSQFPLVHGSCQFSKLDAPTLSIYLFNGLRIARPGPTATPASLEDANPTS